MSEEDRMSFELDEEHEKLFTKIIYDALQEKFTTYVIKDMLQEFSKKDKSTRISPFIINPNDAKKEEDMIGLNLKVTLETNNYQEEIKRIKNGEKTL